MVAPVCLAWVEAGEQGIDLFARDGYHANPSGAWLAAMMLARALGIVAPEAAPPPDGVDLGTGAALAGIAARYS